MNKDTSRHGSEKLTPFQKQLVRWADRTDLTYRPWRTYGVAADELVDHVRSVLDRDGAWWDYAELSMGAGPTARIELIERDGVQTFLAIGGPHKEVRMEYRTLESALDMAVLFAKLGWELSVALGWRDSDRVAKGEWFEEE
jgi:hypothetical protein